MKIAAVVTLYHPVEETLVNINSYYNYVDKIFVYDNTEKETALRNSLCLLPKIDYFHDGHNEGIAKRLNAAATMAINEGYDWLLMMDQDSAFSADMIENYLKCFKNYLSKNDIALFGINYEQHIHFDNTSCEAVFSEELITSGTLLNLSLFTEIGLFDENLFIDAVDNEYTIRTLLAGYKIIQFPNIQLNHQIGTLLKRASIKTLFLVKKDKKVHSPLRCYYIYRNNLYLQHKYKNTRVALLKKLDVIASSEIMRALYYGRNLGQLIYYIFKAKKDFKDNRMGKLKINS